MEVLQMDPSYADRDLNVGFSGGEKKKAEILQLLMLERPLPFSMRPTPAWMSMRSAPFLPELRHTAENAEEVF